MARSLLSISRKYLLAEFEIGGGPLRSAFSERVERLSRRTPSRASRSPICRDTSARDRPNWLAADGETAGSHHADEAFHGAEAVQSGLPNAVTNCCHVLQQYCSDLASISAQMSKPIVIAKLQPARCRSGPQTEEETSAWKSALRPPRPGRMTAANSADKPDPQIATAPSTARRPRRRQCAARSAATSSPIPCARSTFPISRSIPARSYRGLHDSIVNYLGNEKPQMLLCLHEESAVAIAQGYAKVTGQRDGGGGAFQCRPDARHHGDLQRLVRPHADADARRDRSGRCSEAPALDRLDPHRARSGRAGPPTIPSGTTSRPRRAPRASRCCAPTGSPTPRRAGRSTSISTPRVQEAKLPEPVPPIDATRYMPRGTRWRPTPEIDQGRRGAAAATPRTP